MSERKRAGEHVFNSRRNFRHAGGVVRSDVICSKCGEPQQNPKEELRAAIGDKSDEKLASIVGEILDERLAESGVCPNCGHSLHEGLCRVEHPYFCFCQGAR